MTDIRIATLTIGTDEQDQFIPLANGVPNAYYLHNRWVKFIGRDTVGWLAARSGSTGYWILFGPGADGVSPMTKQDLRNDPVLRTTVNPDMTLAVSIAGFEYDQDWGRS